MELLWFKNWSKIDTFVISVLFRTCVGRFPTGAAKTIWKMAKYAENGEMSVLITREIVTPKFQTWTISSREFPSLACYGVGFYW